MTNPEVNTIQEFIIIESSDITPELCVVNDIAKSGVAQILDSPSKLTVIDRCYISTLVYEKTASERRGVSIANKYQSLLSQGFLTQPDIVIFHDIEPSTCIARATANGRFSPVYEWFRNPKAAREEYIQILDELPVGKVIKVSAENANKHAVVSKIIDEILITWKDGRFG